jgi:hypothetical protein
MGKEQIKKLQKGDSPKINLSQLVLLVGTDFPS